MKDKLADKLAAAKRVKPVMSIESAIVEVGDKYVDLSVTGSVAGKAVVVAFTQNPSVEALYDYLSIRDFDFIKEMPGFASMLSLDTTEKTSHTVTMQSLAFSQSFTCYTYIYDENAPIIIPANKGMNSNVYV